MKTLIRDLLESLQELAPLAYQESYDNSGLLTGHPEWEVSNVLLSLDCTEEVVEEAKERDCNVIVCHHPIVFKGLKSLTGANYVERSVIAAIKKDIAIIAWHTNLDNVLGKGVNRHIASKIGLTDLSILRTGKGKLNKLITYIPEKHFAAVADALFAVGCGKIGDYTDCGFSISGTGTFTPGTEANPAIGEKERRSSVSEVRFETVFPSQAKSRVVRALKKAHPYEEVAYDLFPM